MKESQLDNKTSIATNDYVRMVDENGNSVKIKKDSFMAAIRDALPSIISDGETGGGSVLSIINGALKSRTDANLASVLGGLHLKGKLVVGDNLDDKISTGLWGCNFSGISPSERPAGLPNALGTLCVINANYSDSPRSPLIIQIFFEYTGSQIFIRTRWAELWNGWYKISLSAV